METFRKADVLFCMFFLHRMFIKEESIAAPLVKAVYFTVYRRIGYSKVYKLSSTRKLS